MPSSTSYREEERAGSGNVLIGYGTTENHAVGRTRRRARTGAADPVRVPPERSTGPVAVRSPIVRSLARSRGVDLHTVHAAAADGIIRRSDVLGAVPAAPSSLSPAPATPSIPPIHDDDLADREAGAARDAAPNRERQALALARRDPRGHGVGGRRRDRAVDPASGDGRWPPVAHRDGRAVRAARPRRAPRARRTPQRRRNGTHPVRRRQPGLRRRHPARAHGAGDPARRAPLDRRARRRDPPPLRPRPRRNGFPGATDAVRPSRSTTTAASASTDPRPSSTTPRWPSSEWAA